MSLNKWLKLHPAPPFPGTDGAVHAEHYQLRVDQAGDIILFEMIDASIYPPLVRPVFLGKPPGGLNENGFQLWIINQLIFPALPKGAARG